MQWHMPIGYKVIDGKITVCEENRKIVEEIFEDYDSGISATRIAKGLKARGIKNAQNKGANASLKAQKQYSYTAIKSGYRRIGSLPENIQG